MQLIRYGVVGVVSNMLLYLLYLVITASGVEHKLAMTMTYALGVVQTFVFNKRWTFRYGGDSRETFVRYCVAYFLGYAVNFLALWLFVDQLGWSHQGVQVCMVIVVAMLLFTLQKFWVFRGGES
ncbi:MAG: GtrA family protein [Comamonadaceae bacterium]|nr:GtrA family protein [Comamonadaceae bacterium]